MANSSGDLVRVFVPSLYSVLMDQENRKGAPLTHEEVAKIVEHAAFVMLSPHNAAEVEKVRGYKDVDPSNVMFEYIARREQMSRENTPRDDTST